MKAAVIGTGKTGSKVVDLLGDQLVSTFNEHNPVTVEGLAEVDVVIIFAPGDAVPDILPQVLESGTPAVWGSTGYDWPIDLDEQVSEKGSRWIIASNFSLGMNIVRKCIEVISKGSNILPSPEYAMHEVHHIHKKDAPSGTAVSWKQWLGKEVDITHEREGDVKGIHELEMKTVYESIFLRHEALDRAVFASGAIWAAEQLTKQSHLKGIYSFAEIFDQAFTELNDE